MANENVFIKYLNNHGVDAVQLLSAKELAKKTVLTDEEEVEAIVNAMMSRMSNYATTNYVNQVASNAWSTMTSYVTSYVSQSISEAFPKATNVTSAGKILIAHESAHSVYYDWIDQSTFHDDYFSNIATHDNLDDVVHFGYLSNVLSSYATLSDISAFAPASELSSYATLSTLSSYATLADISAFAPASTLSSYVTTSALTQDYMPVWYGSQAAFDALPSSANPNKLYIIID